MLTYFQEDLGCRTSPLVYHRCSMATNLEVEVSDLMEEHQDDLVVEGLCFACQVVVHLEVVFGRANHQLLVDVQEVDLYFIGSLVEDRLVLVALDFVLQLEVVVLAVDHRQLLLFSELMPHLLAMLPTLRHRQYWMKYYRIKMRII